MKGHFLVAVLGFRNIFCGYHFIAFRVQVEHWYMIVMLYSTWKQFFFLL